MESGMLHGRIPRQHDHDHVSSVDDRVEKLFGCFREEFLRELSVHNLGPKYGYYGTFLSTQLMIPNSADMEKRIENLFGHFRENFQGELTTVENLGPQFGYYGTFLPAQLRESQASNAATENHSSNSVQLKSLPGIGQKTAEPVRTAVPQKVNTIKIQITKRERKTDVEPQESTSKILELMTTCPLSGKPMVTPLKRKLFDLRSVRTVSTDPVVLVEDKFLQAPKRCTSDKLGANSGRTNTKRVKMDTQFSTVLKPNTRTDMEKARSPLLQSKDKHIDVERHAELHANEEKLSSARPRLTVKIKIRNQSKVKEVHGNGKCPDFCEEPLKPKKKEVLKVDAARRNRKLEDLAARNVTQGGSAMDHDVIKSDNWVQCDKCHKWRLLPHWMDPEELTIKWSCSQINWLAPGMNSCEINARKYTMAINKIRRHDPLSGKERKQPHTKRPSTENILESQLCQKKRKLVGISFGESIYPYESIITKKRRITRKRPSSTSSSSWSQQIPLSTGSSCVLRGQEEEKIGICTDVPTINISEEASLCLSEACDFKHRADRLKRESQETLSNQLYLEAVLKFLQVASLWEHMPGNKKQDAMRLLLETAELSKYCASQCHDMQAAVLYEAVELANKRAALLKSHPKTDSTNHQSEIDNFIIRSRQAIYM